MADRDLDVVVLGATGVTGRRVAAYLAERAAGTDLRWAAAARDPVKLQRLLAEDGVSAPESIVAAIGDPASLLALARRARVVLDLVGPYTLYGRPVIEACIAGGAHYADLTGEMPFVRGIIDDLQEKASAAGVKIAQVCGFEALPADLAALLAAETARERHGEGLASVEVEVSFKPPPGLPRPSDGMSGGTLQSLIAVAGADNSDLISDPAALIPEEPTAAEVRRVSPIVLAPRRGRNGEVIAPMAPAPFINPAVIHRTAAVCDAEAGRAAAPFRYREGVVIGSGGAVTLPLRWGVAGALSVTQVGLRGFAGASPRVRRRLAGALGRIGPGSGYGPAADRLEGWRWTMAVHALTPRGNAVDVRIDADGHPGYLATARMLGELGILLAEDGATTARAGCLTPALALGTACIERFDLARVRFSLLPEG
ncbi:MAG TPA: saccharopine dehydrogenase NADP-binding domain-containing protein [Solirubrobacteraceae bacterium]